MILFQKVYNKLFFLGILFFCPFVFSNQDAFDPMLFSPDTLAKQVILPQNTPVKPLCPKDMLIQLCLTVSSFPLIKIPPEGVPSVNMYTPFSHQSQEISSVEKRDLLSAGKWRSYEYSADGYKLKTLSESQRDVTPKGDYYRIHLEEKSDGTRGPSRVIQEEQKNGKHNISSGNMRTIPAEKALSAIKRWRQTAVPPPKKNPQETPGQDQEDKSEPEFSQSIKPEEPAEAFALNYGNIDKKCEDINSGKTEATAICLQCTDKKNRELTRYSELVSRRYDIFNTELSEKRKTKICSAGGAAESVKNIFNEDCGNISFDDYLNQLLICEACKNRIPPALMLSIMSIESMGKCDAKGDRGKSHGLFQIYTEFHGDPDTCNTDRKTQQKTTKCCSDEQKNTVKHALLHQLKEKPKCLDNPVTNIRKSMEILKNDYRNMNEQTNDYQCNSSQMDETRTNKWRKVLAAYNGGRQRYVKKLAKKTRPQAISQEMWDKMDEWQKIRTQYFFDRRLSVRERMQNLAYVEVALGGIGSARNQLSLFNIWAEKLKDKINQSQCDQ